MTAFFIAVIVASYLVLGALVAKAAYRGGLCRDPDLSWLACLGWPFLALLALFGGVFAIFVWVNDWIARG